jgi:hypothetical protein
MPSREPQRTEIGANRRREPLKGINDPDQLALGGGRRRIRWFFRKLLLIWHVSPSMRPWGSWARSRKAERSGSPPGLPQLRQPPRDPAKSAPIRNTTKELCRLVPLSCSKLARILSHGLPRRESGVGTAYWTVPAPDIVNSGREKQGSVSV